MAPGLTPGGFPPVPPPGTTTPCKACGDRASRLGEVDFAKNCEERNGFVLPASGTPVAYFRCASCGFLFTRFFDAWTAADFARHIYNDRYAEVDRDWAGGGRAAHNAAEVIDAFGGASPLPRVLDWGGGSGALAERLREAGFPAGTWDPFSPGHAAAPEGTFDLVTAFEVLEHLVDPEATLRRLVRRLAPDGVVMLSTCMVTPEVVALGLDWWYASPRNAHMSLYTAEALAALWGRAGLRFRALNPTTGLAWRQVPAWAAHRPDLFG